MKVLEMLRRKPRTLLEMYVGMILFGLICQLAGLLIRISGVLEWQARWRYTCSLWFGIAAAILSAWHMYRTLDRSLDFGEAAVKLIFKGYIFRYVLIVLIMLIIIMTEVLNPLIAFGGYMSLKVSALIQPFTHKICNKIFNETEPEPESLPVEENLAEEQV